MKKKQAIKIETSVGKETVMAEVYGIMAAHASMPTDRNICSHSVTHVATGLRFVRCRSMKRARKVAKALGRIKSFDAGLKKLATFQKFE